VRLVPLKVVVTEAPDRKAYVALPPDLREVHDALHEPVKTRFRFVSS